MRIHEARELVAKGRSRIADKRDSLVSRLNQPGNSAPHALPCVRLHGQTGPGCVCLGQHHQRDFLARGQGLDQIVKAQVALTASGPTKTRMARPALQLVMETFTQISG